MSKRPELVPSTADFRLCNCGLHGAIVLHERDARKECCSVEEAMADLSYCWMEDQVTRAEMDLLTRQICGSGLTPSEKAVPVHAEMTAAKHRARKFPVRAPALSDLVSWPKLN